jgi:hypothetical protein
MKNITFLLVGIFFISALTYSQSINGSGNIIKKDLQVSKIEKVVNLTSANIIITQSESDKLTVELDDNLIQYFEYKGDKNEIEITFNKSNVQPTKFNVYINVSDLKKLENNGSGNISSTNTIKAKSFEFEHTGSGNSNINIYASTFKSEITGSGNAKINSDAEICSIEHTGSGNISISNENNNATVRFEHTGSGKSNINTKCKILDLSVMGSGDTKLQGNAATLNLEATGSGDISGENFITDNSKINMYGSGNAELKCNISADIEITGSGDLKLSGDYKIGKISMTGSGKLIK